MAKRTRVNCEVCNSFLRPVIKNGTVCQKCFDRFISPLRNESKKAMKKRIMILPENPVKNKKEAKK